MAQLLTFNEPKVTYMDKGPKTPEDWKLFYDYRRALRKTLTPTEYLIFDIIIDKVEETQAGWSCSYTEISELGDGLATNTINHAIQKLEGLGLLTVDRPKNFNQKIANVYHPVKWPTPQLVNFLNCKYEEYIAAKNAAKAKRNEVRCKNNSEHAAKNAATSLQKMQTNDTHETHNELSLDTNVSNGGDTTAAPLEDISPHQEKIRKKEKVKARDKPTLHASLEVFQKEFKLLPPKRQHQGIIDAIGDDPEVIVEWGKACHKWNFKGYSPTNLDGLINFYQEGNYKNVYRGNERGRSERPDRPGGPGTKDSGKTKSISELWDQPEADLKEQFNRELLEYGLRPQF